MEFASQNKPKDLAISQAYLNAPQQVQQMLSGAAGQDGSFSSQKLDFQKLGFQVKKTDVNFCQKKLQIGKNYYVCQTCSNYSPQIVYLFCHECYDHEKHVDHSVEVKQVIQQSQGTCDCGIIERLDKSSFCSQHSSFSVQLDCQINQEESQKFRKSFGSLFEIVMIQEENDILFQFVCNYLLKLNQNSIYYNRLTFQLLSQQCSQRFQGEKYLYLLSKLINKSSLLTMWICGDLKTRKSLTKLVCQFIFQDQSQDINCQPFKGQTIKQMINLTTIQGLISQGFYHEIFNALLKNIEENQKSSPKMSKKNYDLNQIYQKMITSQLNQLKKFDSKLIKKLAKLVKSMNESQLVEAVKKTVSLFPDSESIKKYMRAQESQQENPWAKFQLIQNKEQQSLQNLPSNASQLLHLFVDLSTSLIIIKGLDQRNFKNFLMQSGLIEQTLESMIYWVAACSKGLFYRVETQKQIKLIGILIIISSSTKQQQLLQKAHHSLFGGDKQEGIEKIGRMVQKFYFILSILLVSDIWMMIKRKRITKCPDLENNSNSQRVTQFLKNWLRSFLYSKKVVSQYELIDLKKKGVVDFKGVGSILDQLCTFNYQQGQFNYSSSKVYKNLTNEFPLFASRDDFDSIYSSQVTYADAIPIQQGSMSKNIIELFLNSKTLLQLFREEWKNYLLKEQKDTGYKYPYLYLFFLVVYNSLTKGQSVEVKQELQLYRKNQQILNDWTKNEDEIISIKKLLSIDQNVPIKSQQSVQKPNQMKAKGSQKKKKLAEKFEKKRLLFLERIPSFKNQSSNQEQQICILCHQKKKINDDIVYIGAVNKKTMCEALYGNDNRTNTLMNTCFHALHINCYINLEKSEGQSFKCPLCQAYCNCIIPVKFDGKAKRLNKIIQNVNIVLMVSAFQIYEPEDNFMVIFKHLVESKGLNSLIYEPLYSQKLKINTKRDDFLQQLMMEKYENEDKQGRQEYIKCIQSFINQLRTQCSSQWVKNVQLLFAQSLLSIITLRESNQQVKLLEKIKLKVKSEDYAIILEQFLHIMEEQFQLPFDQAQTFNENSISLSLPEIKLPLNVSECKSKFSKVKCENCSVQSMSILCLFCGKSFCYECKEIHEKNHHQHIFYFNLVDVSIYCRNQRQNTIECLYQNEFKLRYNQIENYEAGTFAEDQFELNEKFLVKKVCSFFAN